jgi:hypothetical protein
VDSALRQNFSTIPVSHRAPFDSTVRCSQVGQRDNGDFELATFTNYQPDLAQKTGQFALTYNG